MMELDEQPRETGSGPVDAPDQRGRAEHLTDVAGAGHDAAPEQTTGGEERRGGTWRRMAVAMLLVLAIGGTLLAMLVIGIVNSR